MMTTATATRPDLAAIEVSPEAWRRELFPGTFTAALAPYQDDFWRWLWAIDATGTGPDGRNCFVAVWPRGWAKSTHIETGCIALAAHAKRRYGWYVSSKQSQADDHIGTASEKLASSRVDRYYPDLAAARMQMVGDKSRQLAWRRNRIWTQDGFALDALGLDSAIRGAKLGDQRPDFMIFDDVDEELDAEGTIDRKIAALNRRIIPAAAPGCVYVVGQNLVHPNGIVTRLIDGRATYLGARTISGPHPAIEGLAYEGTGTEAVITAGRPTWAFMGLDVCQQKIQDAGIDSFLAECQHEVTLMGEPRFDREALAVHERNLLDPLPPALVAEKGLPLDPYLYVWGLPIAGVPYVMYFDGAEGKGSDYCATAVLRADTKQLVALLHDNTREQAEHAKVAAELWRAYNRGLVGWERSHEADFASVMAAEGVDRIYMHAEEPTLAQRVNGTTPTTRRGYPARQRERRILVSRTARYIERFEGAMPSRLVFGEWQTFIKTAKQPDGEASPGNHDDAAFAYGGGLLMCEVPGAQTMTGTGETDERVKVMTRGNGW